MSVARWDYMARQADLTERMRCAIVDWLAEVTSRFKLKRRTLALAVDLMDDFLSRKQCQRSNLQLVAITALLLASKHSEVFNIAVDDVVHVCAKAYTAKQIRRTERLMMLTLDCRLCRTLACDLVPDYAQLDAEGRALAFYLVELSLMESTMHRFSHSVRAASAVKLAQGPGSECADVPSEPECTEALSALMQRYSRGSGAKYGAAIRRRHPEAPVPESKITNIEQQVPLTDVEIAQTL